MKREAASGALAPNARVRKALLGLVPKSSPPAEPPLPASDGQRQLALAPVAPRPKPRLDWAGLLRRTFALDVFTCAKCGGRRTVLALVTNRDTAREVLLALGLPHEAPATGPPPRQRQLALAL